MNKSVHINFTNGKITDNTININGKISTNAKYREI